jgi:hypothetical protein
VLRANSSLDAGACLVGGSASGRSLDRFNERNSEEARSVFRGKFQDFVGRFGCNAGAADLRAWSGRIRIGRAGTPPPLGVTRRASFRALSMKVLFCCAHFLPSILNHLSSLIFTDWNQCPSVFISGPKPVRSVSFVCVSRFENLFGCRGVALDQSLFSAVKLHPKSRS